MTTKKQTIKQKYEPRRKEIEQYGRDGFTMKQIARNMNIAPEVMTVILKQLDISLIYLRNYKHY